MRILAVLRGVPGVGKTTWIQQQHFEPFTISLDKLRHLFCGIQNNIEGKLITPQPQFTTIKKLLEQILETRMKKGVFTIIDATNTTAKSFELYKKFCKKYRYRLVIIEFSINNDSKTLMELIERNKTRLPEWSRVSSDVVERMFKNFHTPLSESLQRLVVSPDQFIPMFKFSEITDLNSYNKVVCFGDIHSCIDPVKQYFQKNPYNENTFYIFTGDYIDRGLQHQETIDFIHDIKDRSNVILLMGNHEHNIETILFDNKNIQAVENKRETYRTVCSLSAETLDKLFNVVQKCRMYFVFTYDNKKYIVTHSGVPSLVDNFTYSSFDVIKGIGSYDDINYIDQQFVHNTDQDWFSIHGHRNIKSQQPIMNTERTFNLCDDIEYGGNLRVLEITKD